MTLEIEMDKQKTGTVMLVSGEMEKALTALMIVTGFAAMGMKMKLWFTLWGVNCIKKPKRFLFFKNRKFDIQKEKKYRNPKTDHMLQEIVKLLSTTGADNLPLSQLNMFGLGPMVFNILLKKKGLPTLAELLQLAQDMDVEFTVCQICIDAFGLSSDDLIIPDAQIKGVTTYYQDILNTEYSVVI